MSQELTKFDDLKAEVAKRAEPAKSLVVTSFESSVAAIEVGKQIASLLKQVEDRKRSITKPFRDLVDQVNDYAKGLMKPLQDADTHIRAQLNAFAAEQEKIRQAELRKVEEERRRKEEELAKKQLEEAEAHAEALAMFGSDDHLALGDALTVTPEPTLEQKHVAEQAALHNEMSEREYVAKSQNIKNVRKTLKIKSADLTKVPREFLILNEKAALAAIKAGVTIPGIETVEEVNVALGSKTYVPRAALAGSGRGE